MDQSMFPSARKQEHATATLFAKTAGELPLITKVGTVLRLHRSLVNQHKSQIHLNCDVGSGGSWVIFDPTDGVSAVGKSSPKYTFTPEDRKKLAAIRKFSKEYFARNELAGITLADAAAKQPKDFDILCYIIDIKKKGNIERALITDGRCLAKMDVPVTRGLALNPQDVVKVRSANFFNDELFRSITLKDYSNILRVPSEFRSAQLLLQGLNNSSVPWDIKTELMLYSPSSTEPVQGSHILNAHKQHTPVRLQDIFNSQGRGKYFRVRVHVEAIGPKEPREWLSVANRITKRQASPEELPAATRMTLPSHLEYYFKLQLFVRDRSCPRDTSLYTIFLCSIDGKGGEFFNVQLGREEPGRKILKRLKKVSRAITRTWVELELMLEAVEVAKQQPVFFVTDTVLNF